MWHGTKVALVVPAYREARLIGRMLRRVPAYVDGVFVVDDASPDRTLEAAREHGDARLRTLRHGENRGVGAAIVSGYRAALGEQHAVMAVMAGDDQMHPDDLEAVIAPVARGEADYVKGNRFVHPEAHRMPILRRLGGEVLSFSTRRATGLDVTDTQCGFTAISAALVQRLPLDELWPRYGYPNDLLGLLSSHGARVREVPVRPVYADESSGLRARHVLSILGVIGRRYLRERSRAL
ncbi:MAG: glycosyltransferase family 2 protein [Polyangiaceae bacterium]